MKIKPKTVLLLALVAIVLLLIAIDIIVHPISGNLYRLISIQAEDITEVRINHYGKTLAVTDKKTVAELVALFDCQLSRSTSDYIAHSTGCDWTISFVDSQGNTSQVFGFYPSDGNVDTKVKIGHYHYFCNKIIVKEYIELLWKNQYD